MTELNEKTIRILNLIKEHKPLVHSITNYVTVNDCANALLAIGARPVMSHAVQETRDITSGSDCLELNLGATEFFESMLISAQEANAKGIPIIIDPVGISGSTYRREFLKRLISECFPTAIRGNRSEILALIKDNKTEIGVDSVKYNDGLTDDELLKLMCEFCKKDSLNRKKAGLESSVILICSGANDKIASATNYSCISGGSEMMSHVTGTGCISSVILGAFMAVSKATTSEDDTLHNISYFDATNAAIRFINYSAERAAENLHFLNKNKPLPYGKYGSGSYHKLIIDALNTYK